jgi:hypothetical protein
MNSCFRLYVLLFLTFCVVQVSAQSTTVHAVANQQSQRELWLSHGRIVPGQSAAALRYRAQGQKLQLRAAHAALSHMAGTDALPHTAPGTIWTPLGTAPLASDASGLGVQDYGPVSGRATAVAIDPADATGNTVYIGRAYGGVWKSTDAAGA